jgi:hypothetical protein
VSGAGFDALLEELVQEGATTVHHGRPGLPAARKRRFADRMAPFLGEGDPPEAIDLLLSHTVAAVREVGAILLAHSACSAPIVLERARSLALDDDWEVREWAVEPLVAALADDPSAGLMPWIRAGGRLRRAAVLAARHLVLEGRLEAQTACVVADAVVDDSDPYVQANVGGFYLGDALVRCFPQCAAGWLAGRVRAGRVSGPFWKNVTALCRSAGARRQAAVLRPALDELLLAGPPRSARERIMAFRQEGGNG